MTPKPCGRLAWCPFQLAFILMNLDGLTDHMHADRETVDLLFFPTGGGKTEAYLGLAAYTIVHRRLSAGGVLGAGVTVLMRYTLRLLTLDQLARAAGVMCALRNSCARNSAWRERRQEASRRLADRNRTLGRLLRQPEPAWRQGQQRREHRRSVRVFDGSNARKDVRPRPRSRGFSCPWCATPFGQESFTCTPERPRTEEHGNSLAPTSGGCDSHWRSRAAGSDRRRGRFTGASRGLPDRHGG